MRVGMITFHRAMNLGANLQAFALNRYISQQIAPCEIIDFYPNNQVDGAGLPKRILRRVSRVVLFPRYARARKFEAFQKSYILSPSAYQGDRAMETAPPAYDVLVAGSDQIFNVNLSGCSRSYYLTFAKAGRKLAYAASFGREEISEREQDLVKSELSGFYALSVREKSGGEIIRKLIGRESTLVADPVFLLSAGQWEQECGRIKNLPEQYIFVYSMEDSPVLEAQVDSLCGQTGLPVIVVRGGGTPGRIRGREDKTCGPREFLRYIQKAEYVVTNSFHGASFAVIMGRKLLCIRHSTRNARLHNLLQLLDREEKLVTQAQEAPLEQVVDGLEVRDRLEGLIETSKTFLKQGILE